MIDQIKIDVLRTRQSKPKEYKERLENLLLEYFFNLKENFEYFQGFNHITAFLFDIYPKTDEVYSVLDYLSFFVLRDYFNENISLKLNVIHFQISNLIQYYYPEVDVY